MKSTPRISEVEWKVMKVCWARQPLTAQEIIVTLSSREEWHVRTVKTLLNRLVKKGALGFKKEGRIYLYQPLVREEDSVAAASRSFVNRVFGGSLKPMLAHFVENWRLSPKEIAEIKDLLKQKEKK